MVQETLAGMGHERFTITDRASTFGHNRWSKVHGPEAIYGVELAVNSNITARKSPNNFMTFLAKDSVVPIYELVARATEQFYYTAKLSYADIADLDSVFVLIGEFPRWDLIGEPRPGWYFPVAPGTSLRQVEEATRRGFPIVATSNNFYPRIEDQEAYEILCGRNARDQTYPMHLIDADDWADWFPELGSDPIDRTYEIAAQCQAELRQAELVEPDKPRTLLHMCESGAARKGVDLVGEYRDRLLKELGIIGEKGFEDYFYIIEDLCRWAKNHMFVGPARGSSCGSLVCYLLDITEVDPIKHGLIFERFIDINRPDLPDIDIDFSDRRRHLAEKYLRDKYGADRVARLGTVSMYKAKSTINETSAALDVPKWEVTDFSESIEGHFSGDALANKSIADALENTDAGVALAKKFPEMKIATQIEGHPRHAGQHAAGVVITKDPLTNYAAMDNKTGAIMVDKYDAEDLNLLKIDCLGLTQLSIFEDTLDLIGKDRPWLKTYPIDDPAAFEVINDRRYTGIFQFQGQATQSLCDQVDTIDSFEDIVSITALARPGPLNSGGASLWAERRSGRLPVKFDHDLLEPILGDTYGVITYQEQIMRICRDVGGMSWTDVSDIRKAMSKSLGLEYFSKFKTAFIDGAKANGVRAATADRIWEQMKESGGYAFNKSHAVAYGLIGYWCCVLKSRHPLEFAAATLGRESDTDQQIQLLRELESEGIGYIPVDVERSTARWEVSGDKLLGPLTGIHGIGPKIAAQIVKLRGEDGELPGRAAGLLADPRTPYDSLHPIGEAFPALFEKPGPGHPFNLSEPLTRLVDLTSETLGHFYVVGEVTEYDLNDHNDLKAIARRGYEMTGPTKYLNVMIKDDSGSIQAQFNRFKYDGFGIPLVERGPGHVYLFKGEIRKGFRRLYLEKSKYVGQL
jgi:DNA-directed DNA polymerase III PolC